MIISIFKTILNMLICGLILYFQVLLGVLIVKVLWNFLLYDFQYLFLIYLILGDIIEGTCTYYILHMGKHLTYDVANYISILGE